MCWNGRFCTSRILKNDFTFEIFMLSNLWIFLTGIFYVKSILAVLMSQKGSTLEFHPNQYVAYRTQEFVKLISRKIWVIEKLLNFYIHCVLESFSQSLFVVWGFRFISSNHYSVSKSWKLKTFTLTMFWQISWKHEISCKRVTFLCFHNVLFVRVSVWNSV